MTKKRNIEAIYPLAPLQEGMLFHSISAPKSGFYFQQFICTIHGPLDVAAFKKAWQHIMDRHPVLRTFFIWERDDKPLQIVLQSVELPWEELDWRSLTEEEQRDNEEAFLQQDRERGFDLSKGPLMRLTLIKLGEQAFRLAWTFHHILIDGWSVSLIEGEVFALYEAFAKGENLSLSPPRPYRDHIAWLQQQDLSEAEMFWRRTLAGFTSPIPLVVDQAAEVVDRIAENDAVRSRLSVNETAALRSMSQHYGLTLNTITQGAWAMLLSRYSGESDIVFGAAVSGRPAQLAGVESMIGLFINTLPTRIKLSPGETLASWLKQIQVDQLEARQYEYSPLTQVQAWSDVPRGIPLFESILVFENFPMDITLRERVGSGTGLEIVDARVLERINYPLTVDARSGAEMSLKIMYDARRFESRSVHLMMGHLKTLLEEIAAAPERSLSAPQMLTPAERFQLVHEWNRTERDLPAEGCMHSLFEAQVERTPDSVAAVYGEAHLTYRQLNERANQLAHCLRRYGVGPEIMVGLCLERSLEMVVGVLGILKAGGAYVPLDPAYPRQRLAFILEDAEVSVLVSERRLQEALPDHSAQLLCLDENRELFDRESRQNPEVEVVLGNLAYVIYTSGSTGLPKGVLVEHRGGGNLAQAQIEAFDVQPDSRVLQFAPLNFDASVSEMLTALLRGATLCLENQESLLPGPALIRTLREEAITTATFPPSVLAALPFTEFPSLRTIVVAGESCPADVARQWAAGRRFLNAYGPTEATVCATIGDELEAGRKPLIGRPISNTQVFVLDFLLRAVPVEVPGEICIGGVGLARGYLNRATATAERFVPDPLTGKSGARMYRSGDGARHLADGRLDFIGRLDHQVKVRGFRIEPGEIEVVLGEHSAVGETVVTVREGIDGDKRLVAYVVPKPSSAVTTAELRQFLRERLPQYMLPSGFVLMEALPLSPNGKIDRRALPAPDGSPAATEEGHLAPRTEIESRIAAVWRDVLQIENLGIRDNFFDLGGHSLLMVRVYNRLRDQFEKELSMLDLFRYPTVAALANHLDPKSDLPVVRSHRTSRAAIRHASTDSRSTEVAIIGMAGRFPGASTPDQFWNNLRDGVESIKFFTDEELLAAGVERSVLADPGYVRARAALAGADLFDAGFFGFTPREAQVMDPQHRVFLECAWESLEAAGYDPHRYDGAIGVYAGVGLNRYLLMNLCFNREVMESRGGFQLMMANEKDFLPTRVSYKLNLKGPSVSIQTACSTSLVAIHFASQSLLNGECDMALAGGVSIGASQNTGYNYQEGGIWSADGHCRAFDATASGTVCGSGAGIVVLKRVGDALADGDHILAVIKGSAINNDGSHKVGYTAPGVEGQAEVISEALAVAQVNPETITYVEAHGTGTELGDPIEIAALTQAFQQQTDKKSYCAIGSLKTNVGHLDAAAGVSGLIKAALALDRKKIPPSLNFERPNPQINFADSPFYVATELSEWRGNGSPRRAGVSSFGMGGTNAHVILEEAPAREPSGSSRPWHLLLLSARSETVLETASTNLANHLKEKSDANPADVAYTLSMGRMPFDRRRIVVCQTMADAVGSLESLDPKRVWTGSNAASSVRTAAFMFPGGGAQHVNMGLDLYRTERLFREIVAQCAEILRPDLGYDLLDFLYPGDDRLEEARERIKRTSLALPALFVVEYAVARLLMSWGIQPRALIGHSLGEYTAACLAGVLTLQDALALVALRGRLFEELPSGAMLGVPLSEGEVRRMLKGSLSLAAINGPAQSVVSGPIEEIDQLARELAESDVDARRLLIDVAAHSEMVEPILKPFGDFVKNLRLNAPGIPFVSNLTGDWITPADATDWNYWVRHLRQTVRFADGMAKLSEDAGRILLEVGPGQSLSALAGSCREGRKRVLSTMRHPQHNQSDVSQLLATLGQFWLAGGEVDWSSFYAGEKRRRLPLPTYPFERQRHWVDPVDQPGPAQYMPETVHKKSNISEWFYVPSWERSTPRVLVERTAAAEQAATWLIFIDECGIGRQLAERLRREGKVVTTVSAGKQFAQLDNFDYIINPRCREDYDALLGTKGKHGVRPGNVVHLWSVTRRGEASSSIEHFEESQDRGFYSLLFLTQALEDQPVSTPLQLNIVSSDLHDVNGDELLSPEKATVLGLCKVIPLECPGISCRNIDIVVSEPESPSAEQLISQLHQEITTASSEPVIAYRGQHRWTQTFKQVPLHDGAESGATRLREGGVYLITGGLGSVGLMIAECLARTVRAKLILLTRSPFPVRAEWPHWSATHGEQDHVSRVIRRLQSFEEMGAKVFVSQTDVGDEAGLRESLGQARDLFGEINGIIHAAGTRSPKTLQEISRIECAEQFRPKVEGLYALEKAFAGRNPDFALIISSLSSVLGIQGLAAYPAAHAFMDAYACRHNRTGRLHWMSVNWDNWLTNRELKPDAIIIGDGLYMTPDEGVEVFLRMMSVPVVPQVLISTANLESRIDKWSNRVIPQDTVPSTEAQPAALHSRPEQLTSDYVDARTEAERLLVGIWRQTLGIERVGIDDNYFDLGGDSVLAIHITARARKAGLRLTPKQLFEHQTISELAAAASGTTRAVEPEPQLTEGPVPLTPIQHWFFEQNQPKPHHWNLSMLLEVREELDLFALCRIMHCLLEKHDALGLRFVRERSAWQQVSATPDVGNLIAEIDLSALAGARQKSAIEETAARLQTSLHLSNGPLWRIALFNIGPGEPPRLLIIIHHLLVDIVSLQILLEDFQTAYRNLRAGEPVELAAVTTPFRTWAHRLSQYARSSELESEADYWLSQPWTKATSLPVDYPGGVNTEASARTVSVSLNVDETRALMQDVAQTYNTQINEVLLTALSLAFSRWTGARSLLINLEGHGREEVIEGIELWRTMGWFTTLFPVLLDLEGTLPPAEALQAVKGQLRRLPNRGIGYGLLRFLSGNSDVVRKLEAVPKPEVAFLYMGQFDQALSESTLFVVAKESAGMSRDPQGMRQHLLDVSGFIFQGMLQLDLTFSMNVYRRSTIEGLAQNFVELLRQIISAQRAAETGYHTPADFPGARLNQQQLDQVIANLSRTQAGFTKK